VAIALVTRVSCDIITNAAVKEARSSYKYMINLDI
jgi:hypothetical protein